MPLVIGFAFFVGIVVLVLLGSRLFGPDSWPLTSDREIAWRARANADRLRQRLHGAVPKTGALGDVSSTAPVCPTSG